MRAITNMVLGSLLGISLALASLMTAQASAPNALLDKAAGVSQEAPASHAAHWPNPTDPGILPHDDAALHHVAPLTPYIVGFLVAVVVVLSVTSLIRVTRRRKTKLR